MKLFSKQLLFFIIIANCLFLISQIPLFLHIQRNPAGSLYPLVHFEFSHDYYAYLAAITQGKAGYLLHFNSYSAEPAAKGIFLVYYLFWGHVARLLSLTSYVTYHIARILSLELFFTSVYVLCRIILKKKHALLGALFSLLITVPPHQLYTRFLGQTLNYSRYPGGILWWAELDAIERLNGIPHHVFGQAMLVLGIAFLMAFLQKKTLRFAVLSGVFFFIGGLVFPAIVAVPVAVCAALLVWRIIREIRVKGGIREVWKLPWFGGFLTILIFALVSLSISFYQERQGFPWNDWRIRELNLWNAATSDFDKTFIFSFAIYLGLGLISSIRFIRSSFSYKEAVIIAWAFLPFLLLPFANFLGIPKIRLTQLAPFVPFSILIIDFLYIHPLYFLRNKFRWAILAVIFIVSIYTSASILKKRIDAAAIYVSGHQMHIPAKEVAALEFIEQNIGKESVVLATERLGNIIPAFVPVVSYLGHSAKTKDFYAKLSLANSFFAGSMNDMEALDFVSNSRIEYVYFGTDEKYLGKTSLTYPFLRSFYEKDGITLYKAQR